MKPEPTFTISRKIDDFSYHALFRYYSKNIFPQERLSEEDIQNRNLIEDFKKGINANEVAEMVKTAILQKTAKDFNENDDVFMVIPASSQADHAIRYRNFCEIMSAKLGTSNGYNAIGIVSDQEALPNGGEDSKLQNLRFDNRYFRNKAVILFDDLIITANLFRQVCRKLIDLGAREVMGAVLGEVIAWDERKNR